MIVVLVAGYVAYSQFQKIYLICPQWPGSHGPLSFSTEHVSIKAPDTWYRSVCFDDDIKPTSERASRSWRTSPRTFSSIVKELATAPGEYQDNPDGYAEMFIGDGRNTDHKTLDEKWQDMQKGHQAQHVPEYVTGSISRTEVAGRMANVSEATLDMRKRGAGGKGVFTIKSYTFVINDRDIVVSYYVSGKDLEQLQHVHQRYDTDFETALASLQIQ